MIWRHTKRLIAVSALLATLVAGAGLAYVQASGSKLFSVQSGSMSPALDKGDLVMVRRVPVNQLQVGDVITFMNPSNNKQTITHRVIALPSGTNQAITKGDANPGRDVPVSKTAIVGKVTHSLSLAGFLVDFVRNPIGLVALIYLPALLIVIDEWRRLMRYFRQKERVYRLRVWKKKDKPAARVLAEGAKVLVPCLVLLAATAVPAWAAMATTATLARNTISAVSPIVPDANNVLISRVEFECTSRNTPTHNNMFIISLHNSTDAKLKIKGWYLESSSGRINTFSSKTLWAHKTYSNEYKLDLGLRFAGDYIALYNSEGVLQDALSWGDNTSHFNPALPAVEPSGTTAATAKVTTFKRTNVNVDMNTAAEWSVTVTAP